ncbi:MAG: radical SAM protein [Rhodospirillales bacterium]|nr:radical SAM protein [Rhodospirillales bacterium]
MKALKVYLCDLTHETIILVSDTIPVNIGYVSAYAKKIHGPAIELSLFKYPQSAIEAIKADPPDILALSNYSWNSNLSERMARLAKSLNSEVVTVQGGTNFPHKQDQQIKFLKTRPATDFHVELEGEVSFSNLVARVLEARDGGTGLYDVPVDGCVFIHPDTRSDKAPKLVVGNAPDRLRQLDDIPSPYLSGLLDKFFDGRLVPFLETNRGCPFKCTFCHTGADYFRKINMYSLDRITEELEYAAIRAQKSGVTGLVIADTNFGMFPRDREICETLLKTQQKYGWPLNIVATTGKNNKQRVIDITGILGDTFDVAMSVQSMDSGVLDNINRSNIKLDDYMEINQHLREQGRATTGEMILGLPGETRKSFISGIEKVISAGVSTVTIYSLMLLYGTEFQDPAYRKKYGYDSRFRIVPLNFGEYDGERVFDSEEVGVATKDLSFDDYLNLRRFALLVETLYNNRPFEAFFRYAMSLGESRFSFLYGIFQSLDNAPDDVARVVDGFMAETRSELWSSEQEMIDHYRQDDAYRRLKDGEVGGNLIYKYKSMSLALTMPGWIAFLTDQLKNLAGERPGMEAEIDALAEFSRNRTWKFLEDKSGDETVTMSSAYDFIAWLDGPEDAQLAEYASESPIGYVFEFTEDQKRSRQDAFRRYGTDVNGLSKIVTRIVLQSLFRKVREQGKSDDGDDGKVRESNTRYALAH